jgi:hypothetical protein
MRRVVIAVVAVACLGAAQSGLAAHPRPGATYTGNSGKCSPQIRHQCDFTFRVSRDGTTLRSVKKSDSITLWACHAGGGEAVLGPGKNAEPIPVARIRADGTFSGTGGSGSRKLVVSGSFTGSGKTAVLKFALPRQGCKSPSLKLTSG